METQKPIFFITILLALSADYCGTVTFISVDILFSAHVTGNFIVFAYDILKHADTGSWLKLLSFPVFIIAVICGGNIAARSNSSVTILLTEGVILAVSGITWIAFSIVGINSNQWAGLSVAMCVVFSMGLQNAFGKIYSKETYGPTTMMTGNVTQAALELGKLLKNGVSDLVTINSLRNQEKKIPGFLAGGPWGADF